MTLGARWLVVLGGSLIAGSSYFLFTTLKSELSPVEDRGVFMGIGLAPGRLDLDFTDHYAQQIEALYKEVPEIKQYFVVTGYPVVSQMIGFARLWEWEKRERKQQEISASLAPKFFGIPGLLAFLAQSRRSASASPTSRCSSWSRPRSPTSSDHGRQALSARQYPAWSTSTATSSSTSLSSRSTSTATRSRAWVSRSTPSGARSRPCSAAAR